MGTEILAMPDPMGEVYAEVVFTGPGGEARGARLLVDTGSTFTWVSAETLTGLGVARRSSWTFETIEADRRVDRGVGDVWLEFGGEGGFTRVVFADPGDAEVLGLHALETLGLEVDPFARVLRRSDALKAYGVRGHARALTISGGQVVSGSPTAGVTAGCAPG